MSFNKNILVTGGAGFIGSNTVVALIEAGYSPIILDDFRNSEKFVIDRIHQITNTTIPVLSVDICDKKALFNVLTEYKIDGIIHFAAYKAVGESVSEPLKYYENNITGLINILEYSLKTGIENFVFSSSCTVYGNPKNGSTVDESSEIVKANSPYGNTKIIGEHILDDVCKSGANLKTLCLRYFNPIGAHSSGLIGELPIGKPNNLLPFVTQTAAGILDELVVFGDDYPTHDGTCLRDYIHVSDLADAHVRGLSFLFDKNEPFVEAINIGTGNGTSTLEVISTFEKISNVKLNWKFGPRRSGDVMEIFADVSKAKSLLGWEAKFSVEDAIRDAWNWQQKLNNAQ